MKKKKYRQSSSFLLAAAAVSSCITSLLLPQCASSFATNQPSSSQTISPINNDDSTINLPILYENDHLLAISKPPHISHHDDPQSNQRGILSVIRHQQQSHTFAYPNRLYGVHRLDRVTSGILLLAKSSTVANELRNKSQHRKVTKYYMAVSGKKPRKKKQGWVKGQMVLGRRGSYKLVNTENKKEEKKESSSNSGNYAVTRFYTAGLGNVPLSPLVQVNEEEEQGSSSTTACAIPKTAMLFQPHTGKTHQLRVAAKSVGLPILGDSRYGGGQVCTCSRSLGNDDDEDGNAAHDAELLLLDRTYLHAAAIRFELYGEEVCIYSPPPFGHLFSTSSESDDVFVGMMKKHCRDDDPILHHIDKFKTM